MFAGRLSFVFGRAYLLFPLICVCIFTGAARDVVFPDKDSLLKRLHVTVGALVPSDTIAMVVSSGVGGWHARMRTEYYEYLNI